MISTVSLSFDLTYTDPLTGTITPRCVVTDSTTYPFAVDLFSAKGYGVLTFNGDVIDSKSSAGNPLIDLEAGDTTGFFDLPLDNNGNVANGVYGFQYSLRLDSTASGVGYVGTVTGDTTFTSGAEWLVEVLPIGSSIGIDGVNNTVAGAVVVGSDAVITLGTAAANGPAKPLTFIDDVSVQFSATYSYAGCTQTSADVDFIYDCEYGDSGTWSVSNATVLGSNEIVNSLLCTINYPSWTSSDPAFNPQVITNALPYPTLPGDNTPLATGTYSVSLTEQIQQTQASGLVVLYNKSVIKEFAVSCAGTLCGLVPCIENLRAAHAAELVRNKVSKYQVYVDNVSLYYMEAMNYKACGELDKYKSTIDLLQTQLDASGCDCACCDDQSYYWVANNSANSIIDELLANFQYRLFDGGIGDPGTTQPGVQYGAIWQNTNTGVLYRCIDASPGNLEWEIYYDPSIVPLTGADNGLSVSGSDVVLGGSLDNNTTIDLNTRKLTLSGTTGDVEISASIGTALDVTGGSNTLDVTSTVNTAATLTVDRAANNTVATNLVLKTSVDGGNGAVGLGSSVLFQSENSAGSNITIAGVQSSLTDAATGAAKFEVTLKSPRGASQTPALTINDDFSVNLSEYGGGTITGSPEYYLAVDTNGNVIESNPVTSASNGLSISGSDVILGGSLDAATTIDLNTRRLTLSGTTGDVYISANSGTALDVTGGVAALNVEGTSNTITSVATTDVAAVLKVNATTNNTVSKNLILRTNVDGGNGAAGLGSSVVFQGENNTGVTFDMAEIKTTMTDASSGASKFDFTLKDLRGSSLVPAMTINDDFSLNLSEYGSGTFTGTPEYSLSVDSSGNVIETAVAPKVYVARITQTGSTPPTATVIANTTGATFTWGITVSGIYSVTASSPVLTTDKTAIYVTPSSSGAYIMMASVGSTTQCTVTSSNAFGLSGYTNGLINGAIVKIEIYP